jgi:hypothetical protein
MKFNTMSNSYFHNPIRILHRLKEAGFTEKQAEAQVEIFNDYVENGLATKRDLKELELATKRDFKELELATKRDFKEFELKVDSKLKELELRLTVKTAAIVGSIVGFFSVLEKIF